jgi:glycolate oxidase FAD binding subunit
VTASAPAPVPAPAPAVVRPASLEEAAAALREASAAGRSVSIGRDGGDVVIDPSGLDRILEHEPGDLIVIVEAGLRLSALDAALAPHGQLLALDAPGDPTVGACLAANLSGPRRHRYGAPRDLVLGATLVLADGTVTSSGGKVVKNVAGFDLAKLACGSQGRLGLIARVCLRLHPRPAATRTVVAAAASPEEAQRLASAVLRSTLAPSAVDVHWPGRLALLFEGSPRAVAAQVETARSLLGAEEAGDEVWVEAAGRQLAARGRVSFAPGELAPLLAAQPRAVVRAGAGAAYVPDPLPDGRSAGVRALEARIRAQLDPQGVLR